ncbi:MspA family porin [Gordonia sp. (in: high G+C Gram-positive bacteria)]|uniref:MspA family porin n=1 Tax=Gordonia sp. (in: high G+C Gram-positive bacteria) TaxID=84139 RepID=UPI00257DBECA|nr:MspA family porin [Gordonia sp. (in: high G+C Gram-positive bacteria)]
MMRRGWMLVTVLCVALAAVCGGGMAWAAPTALASKYDTLVTDDGWKIELRASELVVNPMSNIANSFASREGWISARVGALITPAPGRTPSQPVQSAVLEQFLVLGCQVDVSDGATFGFGSSVGPNANVTISGQPGVSVGGSASVSPSISAKLKPGRITEISLGKKTLQTNRASIRAKRVHVRVDGCVGPTTVRVIVRFSTSTPTADDTINIHSARMWL